jgi:hypothetical protein
MNFLDAVQALKDGKCGRIRPATYSICEYEINKDGDLVLYNSCNKGIIRQAIDFLNDWQLINPTPQTETVEVKAFGVYREDGYCNGKFDTMKEAESAGNSFNYPRQIVELTGTYLRSVKPKVKRREEIQLIDGRYQLMNSREYRSVIPGSKFFREWEE